MQATWDQLQAALIERAPQILGAIAILGIGWLVALVVSAAIRATLRRTGLGDRMNAWFAGDSESPSVDVPRAAGKTVFFLIMLIVAVAFFQALGLTIVTEPINGFLNQLFGYMPQILGAGVLLLVAWIVATLVRMLVRRALAATGIEARLRDRADLQEDNSGNVSSSIGDVAFYLILFLFLPAILSTLKMDGLLGSVELVTQTMLAYLPNVLAAAVIFLVGWLVARIVRQLVRSLGNALGVNRLADNIGAGAVFGETGLSGFLAALVYVLILIPVILAALNALELDSITGPVNETIAALWAVVPSLLAAALILIISWVLGRFVAGIISGLLSNTAFDGLFVKMGFVRDGADAAWSPSRVVGVAVVTVVMLLAVIEAMDVLGFAAVSVIVQDIMTFATHVVVALIIFGAGLYIANLAAGALRSSGRSGSTVAAVSARVAILGLAGAMALRQMGLADEIINLAFGLLLGAVALASALAFGIGGREFAAQQLNSWRGSQRKAVGE